MVISYGSYVCKGIDSLIYIRAHVDASKLAKSLGHLRDIVANSVPVWDGGIIRPSVGHDDMRQRLSPRWIDAHRIRSWLVYFSTAHFMI